MGASIIARCYAAPVLDPAEDVFDLVALALEVLVVMVLDLAVLARRNARGGAALSQRCPEPVAVWTCNGFVPVTYLIKPPWLRRRAG